MDRDEKFEHLFDDDDEFKTEPTEFQFDEDIQFEEPAEYQFTDETIADDTAAPLSPEDTKPGLFEKLNQVNFKKIVIYLGIAVLVLGFLGALLKSMLSRGKEETAAVKSQIQATQPVVDSAMLLAEEQKKPKGQLEVDVALARDVKALSQQNAALGNRVQVLESQLAQTVSQLNAYQAQTAKAQADAAGLAKTVGQVEDQMTSINNALQALVEASKSPNIPSPMGDTSTLPAARSYTIQAIIPGRAWLKANNGQIITVALGDSIPGFGNVTLIDPQNGVVQTDAGLRINYAINAG